MAQIAVGFKRDIPNMYALEQGFQQYALHWRIVQTRKAISNCKDSCTLVKTASSPLTYRNAMILTAVNEKNMLRKVLRIDDLSSMTRVFSHVLEEVRHLVPQCLAPRAYVAVRTTKESLTVRNSYRLPQEDRDNPCRIGQGQHSPASLQKEDERDSPLDTAHDLVPGLFSAGLSAPSRS